MFEWFNGRNLDRVGIAAVMVIVTCIAGAAVCGLVALAKSTLAYILS